MMADHRPRLVQAVRAEIRQQTGRDYKINLDALSEEGLREFYRMLRDLRYEAMANARRAQLNPWRMPR